MRFPAGENDPAPELGMGSASDGPPSMETVYSRLEPLNQPSRSERKMTLLPSLVHP